MKSYLITYDLIKPGQNYNELYEAIKKLCSGSAWHCLDSVWIVKTNLTAAQICDILKLHIDSNDKLLVVGLSGEGAWIGFDDKCSSWLKINL